MAINKVFVDDKGIEVGYHVITHGEVDFRINKIKVFVSSYVDKSAYLSGKLPYGERHFTFSNEELNTVLAKEIFYAKISALEEFSSSTLETEV